MITILTEYGLPVIALIVAGVSLFFVIKDRQAIKNTIESDKEFMEWRKKHRKNKELKKQIQKLEYKVLTYQKKMKILMGVTITKECDVLISPKPNRINSNKLQEYHEKIIQLEQRIAFLKGVITHE